ncbi:MAG TPA: sigma 54-interacting transcriptional regulator [Acidobacteriaceae bacterium]
MRKSHKKISLRTAGDALYGEQYEALLTLAQNIGNHHEPVDLLRSVPHELHAIVAAETIALITCGDLQEQLWFAVDAEGQAVPSIVPTASMCKSFCCFNHRRPEPSVVANSAHNPDTTQTLSTAQTVDEYADARPHPYPPPLVVQSIDQADGLGDLIKQFSASGNQSLCVLPLATSIRLLGLVCIGRRERNAFPQEELRFLNLVVEHAALAVDNQLNFVNSEKVRARLESEETRLRLILDLNNSVVSTLELRSLLQAIAPKIRKIMQLDGVALILPEPGRKELRLYALDFPASKGIVRQDLLTSTDGTIAGEVFRTGTPWIGGLEDLRGSELSSRMALEEGIESLCFLPLIRCGKVLGILNLARQRGSSFSAEEVEFLGQIANQVAIAVDNALAYGQIAELKEKLTQEKLYFEDEIRSEMNFEEIVGNSPALRQVLRQIETVAPTESTVLIYGETGSGKELIARAVHNLSRRQSSAFVKLNCAAIPTGLLESELFGHEKGAFTGAIAQRIGRFELASDGTIFLDEIGEIPLELQPKLLRVLQEREFERLGGSRTLRTNARLIAATNRDLRAMVDESRFRSDLYYRLNVFPVYVPSLRERAEDIPVLVRHFVQYFSRNINKQINAISSETMQALTRYPWPGNIRELQNVIERAVILSQGRVLNVQLSDLKPKQLQNGPASIGHLTLEEMERRHILAVLEQTNWVFAGPNGAAARLGMKRPTLQFRMQKLGISRPQRSLQ